MYIYKRKIKAQQNVTVTHTHTHTITHQIKHTFCDTVNHTMINVSGPFRIHHHTHNILRTDCPFFVYIQFNTPANNTFDLLFGWRNNLK